MVWPYLVVLVVSVLISVALAPKPPKPDKPNKGDVKAPTATEDEFIPVVFGTCWLNQPNVVWYGNVRIEEIRGKGGKK